MLPSYHGDVISDPFVDRLCRVLQGFVIAPFLLLILILSLVPKIRYPLEHTQAVNLIVLVIEVLALAQLKEGAGFHIKPDDFASDLYTLGRAMCYSERHLPLSGPDQTLAVHRLELQSP
jgi:hypothetical protein